MFIGLIAPRPDPLAAAAVAVGDARPRSSPRRLGGVYCSPLPSVLGALGTSPQTEPERETACSEPARISQRHQTHTLVYYTHKKSLSSAEINSRLGQDEEGLGDALGRLTAANDLIFLS